MHPFLTCVLGMLCGSKDAGFAFRKTVVPINKEEAMEGALPVVETKPCVDQATYSSFLGNAAEAIG